MIDWARRWWHWHRLARTQRALRRCEDEHEAFVAYPHHRGLTSPEYTREALGDRLNRARCNYELALRAFERAYAHDARVRLVSTVRRLSGPRRGPGCDV